jgi:hypothetical protein
LAAEHPHHLLARFVGERLGKGGNRLVHVSNYIDVCRYVNRQFGIVIRQGRARSG